MKRVILLIIAIATIPVFALSQSIKYKEVQNADLRYVLNNISNTTSFNDDKKSLYIKVHNVNDPSGSANNESCEITNSIYIAVSEGGEFPETHLFRLISLYNPKFINWLKTPTGPTLVITYGPNAKRQKASVLIGLKRLIIK